MKKRFEVVETQRISGGIIKIVMDTYTGVNYLMGIGIGISGISPLLDKDGNIVIKKSSH